MRRSSEWSLDYLLLFDRIQRAEGGDNMIDSHIHLSCKCYNQTFPYIDYDGKEFTIAADGRREALIDEMKSRSISCCIEPAIDVY